MAKAILVVDARDARRDRLTAQLQSLASTRATHSALDALRLLDEQRADIVITAVQFGCSDIHGLALGHLIKNRWPDVEVITLLEDGEDIGTDWEIAGGAMSVTPGHAIVADIMAGAMSVTPSHATLADIVARAMSVSPGHANVAEIEAGATLVTPDQGDVADIEAGATLVAPGQDDVADIEAAAISVTPGPADVAEIAGAAMSVTTGHASVTDIAAGATSVTPGQGNVTYLPARVMPVEDPMILKARELLKKAS